MPRHPNDRWLDERCAVCGLTRGAHSGGATEFSRYGNQCPAHEGHMDWPKDPRYFAESGDYDPVAYGTPAK